MPWPFYFQLQQKVRATRVPFLHHTGAQKIPSVSPPSNSSGKRFQINCKMPVYEERDPDCHAITRDLGKNGGVWEAMVSKTVRGLGLCVFQQRFAMHWTLALFLASVFCSLYCWTISTKQRKELVSRDNHLITFCQIWYLEHYPIRAGSAQFLRRFPQICFLLLPIVLR